MPHDVYSQIYRIALAAFAERYLRLAKDKFALDRSILNEHRSYVADILRNSHSGTSTCDMEIATYDMEIEIDPAWMQHLFDLCLIHVSVPNS